MMLPCETRGSLFEHGFSARQPCHTPADQASSPWIGWRCRPSLSTAENEPLTVGTGRAAGIGKVRAGSYPEAAGDAAE